MSKLRYTRDEIASEHPDRLTDMDHDWLTMYDAIAAVVKARNAICSSETDADLTMARDLMRAEVALMRLVEETK